MEDKYLKESSKNSLGIDGFFEESLRELEKQAGEGEVKHKTKTHVKKHKLVKPEPKKHEIVKHKIRKEHKVHKTHKMHKKQEQKILPEKNEEKIPFKIERVKIDPLHKVKILRKISDYDSEVVSLYDKEKKKEEEKLPEMVRRKLIKGNFDKDNKVSLNGEDKYSKLPDVPVLRKGNIFDEFKDIKLEEGIHQEHIQNSVVKPIAKPVPKQVSNITPKQTPKPIFKQEPISKPEINKPLLKSDKEIRKNFFNFPRKINNSLAIEKPQVFYDKVKKETLAEKRDKKKEIFHKEIDIHKEKPNVKVFERRAMELPELSKHELKLEPQMQQFPSFPELPKVVELPSLASLSSPAKSSGNLKLHKEIKQESKQEKVIKQKTEQKIVPENRMKNIMFIESEKFNKIAEDISSIGNILAGKERKISRNVFENRSLNKNQMDENLENIEKIRSNLFKINSSLFAKLG